MPKRKKYNWKKGPNGGRYRLVKRSTPPFDTYKLYKSAEWRKGGRRRR